jgi:hypothetical protein
MLQRDYGHGLGPKARAALAKHGTQAAAPDHVEDNLNMVVTAYGEKVREAAANALNEWLLGFADDDAEVARMQDAIRSMPLPAQSEGEEK